MRYSFSPKEDKMLSVLPYDILVVIKSYLTYKDRTAYIRLCLAMKGIPLESFERYTTHCIRWPKREDPSYLLVYRPFPVPYESHPCTFLGNHHVSIILYDTAYTYYHIRMFRTYDPKKTLRQYLAEYEPMAYYVNKITKYVDG